MNDGASVMTKTCTECGVSVPETQRICDCGNGGFRLDGKIEAATFTVTAYHTNGLPGFHMPGATISLKDDVGNVIDECEISMEIAGRALYLSRDGCHMQSINLTDLLRAWSAVPPMKREVVNE